MATYVHASDLVALRFKPSVCSVLLTTTSGYILEQEYGMSVAGYYLAQVHPDGDAPRLISCPRMDAEMRAIHNFEIECGRAGPSIAGELAPFTLL